MKPKSIPSQGNLIAPTQGTATPTIARTQTSQKKIEANRQNALLSTGPKTERGKKAVSRNALKYGLFAKEIIITRGEGAENPQEFLQLLRALHEGYKPVGAREMLLVEEIATCIWRKRRVLRFEMGEIQKRLNSDAYLQPSTNWTKSIATFSYCNINTLVDTTPEIKSSLQKNGFRRDKGSKAHS